MNWYHIKTVLILLFAAINLFLAALLGVAQYQNTREEKQSVEAAVEVLAQNGIVVSATVPHKTMRLGGLRLENPKAEPAAFAERVLGGKAMQFDESYRRAGQVLTLSEKGFLYESGKESVTPERKSIRQSREALSKMGFSMEYAKGHIEGNCIVFRQEIDGVPLFDCGMQVQLSLDGTISRIEGNWAVVTACVGEKNRISGAADALLSFLQSGTGGEIVAVECGYAIFVEDAGYRAADAIPVWAVQTKDGKVHYVDARA